MITLNGAQLFHCWLDYPPHWGPYSLQLQKKKKEPICSQAERTVFAHSLATGFCGRRMCVCMHLSLFPVLQSPSFSITASVTPRLFFVPQWGPLHFFPTPIRLPFRNSVIVSPSAIVCDSLSNNLCLARSFPPSSLGGSSVCGPVFELSTSKRFHVAPRAHTHLSKVTKCMLLLKQCSSSAAPTWSCLTLMCYISNQSHIMPREWYIIVSSFNLIF